MVGPLQQELDEQTQADPLRGRRRRPGRSFITNAISLLSNYMKGTSKNTLQPLKNNKSKKKEGKEKNEHFVLFNFLLFFQVQRSP